jgi:hypothetical protein
MLSAVRTVLWTFFKFSAKFTTANLMDSVYELQFGSTWAESVDISDEFPRFRLIEWIGEWGKTSLAYAEVAWTVIVYSIIANCCTDSAYITDKVQIGYPLKWERMSNRAARLCTGRYPTLNAIKMVTNSAEWSRQTCLFACSALRL